MQRAGGAAVDMEYGLPFACWLCELDGTKFEHSICASKSPLLAVTRHHLAASDVVLYEQYQTKPTNPRVYLTDDSAITVEDG